ncbi:Predicted metal-binding protein (DUF2284) [uncultured Blautia sp.]|nr:Predicted metal-binding protein (DUF2284) [uncultured Blautia sp.]
MEDLVFDYSFRGYCEENVCGNYGTNHSCPPDCGTVQEMEERARQYRQDLVPTVKSVWES